MTEHITGQQARELLDGATPGPWRWEVRDYPEYDEGYEVLGNGTETALRSQDADQYASWVVGSDRDKDLTAAAPALAETLAWLYGREPDGYGDNVHRGVISQYDQEAVAAHPEAGTVEVYAAHDHGEASAMLTPDEAVDLARALLAAAEAARRHTD